MKYFMLPEHFVALCSRIFFETDTLCMPVSLISYMTIENLIRQDTEV